MRNAKGYRFRKAFITPQCSVIISAGYREIELSIMKRISGVTAAEIFSISAMVGIARLNMSLVAEPAWDRTGSKRIEHGLRIDTMN